MIEVIAALLGVAARVLTNPRAKITPVVTPVSAEALSCITLLFNTIQSAERRARVFAETRKGQIHLVNDNKQHILLMRLMPQPGKSNSFESVDLTGSGLSSNIAVGGVNVARSSAHRLACGFQLVEGVIGKRNDGRVNGAK